MFNLLKKSNLMLLLLFVSVLFVAGCNNKKKVYVGTYAEFQPFEYLDNGKIVGFDIDLINEIAKLTGREIEIKNISFDGLLPALQSKKLDIIIAGMTATEDRKKFVSFSEPYYMSSQAILVGKDNNSIETFKNLSGHTVGVVLGYTGDIAVSDLPNVSVQRYNGASEAVIALKSGKINAVVLDSEPARNYAIQNPEIKMLSTDLTKEEYAIALRKEDDELLKEINQALVTLKENGTYDKLIEKYFN